jgi:pilus assembly protein FimV
VRSLLMLKLLMCSALLLSTSLAGAVGMGRVNVMSSIGQRLLVEIEIIAATKEERGTLSAKLGSARAYERSSFPMGAAGASGLRVSVEKRANGEPYIRVTSAQPINEPFVNLLIELSSQSGPISREIAVLLDPPEITFAQAAEAAPRPPSALAEPLKPTPAPAAVAVAAADTEYGPVRRGETLSRIASRVRPQDATLEQTMLGIFRNNPAAFINNNMNLLKVGHRLRIPAPDQLTALPQKESSEEFRAQTTAWAAHRSAATTDASTAKPRAAPAEPARAAPAKSGTGGKPVVKLSRGAVGKDASAEDRVRMLEEDLAARERALKDANDRIKRLEKAAGVPVTPPADKGQK